jgi:hypothetical protein
MTESRENHEAARAHRVLGIPAEDHAGLSEAMHHLTRGLSVGWERRGEPIAGVSTVELTGTIDDIRCVALRQARGKLDLAMQSVGDDTWLPAISQWETDQATAAMHAEADAVSGDILRRETLDIGRRLDLGEITREQAGDLFLAALAARREYMDAQFEEWAEFGPR